MRYSAQHRELTRKKILEAASRLFREKGYNGVGVDAVMGKVGLTAGGFYSHFDSKEALFSEAIASALSSRNSSLTTLLKDQHGITWLTTLIKAYLSRSHRDMADTGCPLPSLTPDVSRSSSEIRETYEQHLRIFLDAIQVNMPEGFPPPRERASALIAHLIGGLMLARAVKDQELSDQILTACRRTALSLCQASAVNPTENNSSPTKS